MKSRYYFKNPSFLADITQRLDEVVMLLDCVATKKFQSFFFLLRRGRFSAKRYQFSQHPKFYL